MPFARPLGALALVALTALPLAGAAATLPPLGKDAHVMQSLVAARAADRIRNTCPTISGRIVTAFFKAEALKHYALDEGYSADEIRAFLKDPASKKIVVARAEALLKARGAVVGKPETYCTVGRAEIAAQSLIGALLRAN